MQPNTTIKIIKSKAHLIQDIENLKEYLATLVLDPNSSWGNKELKVFEHLESLSNQMYGVQSVIKKQFSYPKPVKLKQFMYLSINNNWKTMIKLFQGCPGVKDLGPTIIKVQANLWSGDREVGGQKFLIPKGTIGLLMSISSRKNKMIYTIAIPEPVSMKVQKSNYVEVQDEGAFSFEVSAEEKSLLKKSLINLYAGRMRGENLKMIEKINDILKGW